MKCTERVECSYCPDPKVLNGCNWQISASSFVQYINKTKTCQYKGEGVVLRWCFSVSSVARPKDLKPQAQDNQDEGGLT